MRRSDAVSRVLGDRYELRARLGSGGAGTVWRGHDRILGRAVAIKLLHADLAEEPAVEARFRTEATSAAQLTHPNAVQVYDVGRDGADDYLVMELVEGPSLALLLAHDPLPGGTAAAVGARVAGALGAAHDASIVHRDVKPANVLLAPDGRVKLADFGIARVLGAVSARLTRTGTVLGTARYLAPEQLGEDPIDARADVYALGLVLFEALTGHPPFGQGSPIEIATRRLTTTLPPIRELAPEVRPGLEEVVHWATQLEPADRPDDGRALASALAHFAASDAGSTLARRVADHQRGQTAAEATTTATQATETRAPARPRDPPPAPGPATPVTGALRPDAPQTGARDTADATRALHGPGERPAVRGWPPPPPGAEDASNVVSAGTRGRPDRTAAMPTPVRPGKGPAPRTSSVLPWLLVAAIAVAVGVGAVLYLGADQDGDGDGSSPPPSADTRLPIAEVSDHDPPPGSGSEHPDEVGNAIDADTETYWPTESYETAPLSDLKDGVGLWLALEDAATLSNVEVVFSREGGELELWIGDGPPGDDQQPSDWGERIHQGDIGSAELLIEDLPGDVAGDTLLLWFTELPPGGSGHRVEVRDIRVYGE